VDYTEERSRAIVEYPLDVPRFPAVGDRENSFDAALRAFYRKVRYSSFRRLSSRHFQTIRPTIRYQATRATPRFELSSIRAAKRRQSRRLTKNAYLTPS